MALQRRVGERLTLIGVAHILPRSAAEVREAIERDRPEVVAVELCPARYVALRREVGQPTALEALRAGQLRLFVMAGLLQLIQNRFARRAGMPAGEEMLAAIDCAKEVGSKVELIDRDIGTTLERLVKLMGAREKIRLFAELLLGLLPLGGKVEIGRLTEEAVVEGLIEELRRASPTAYEVLIEERNAHMEGRIAEILATSRGKVVCVVGAGHVPGLLQRLDKGPRAWHGLSFAYKVPDLGA